jgi:hypothetical protein
VEERGRMESKQSVLLASTKYRVSIVSVPMETSQEVDKSKSSTGIKEEEVIKKKQEERRKNPPVLPQHTRSCNSFPTSHKLL